MAGAIKFRGGEKAKCLRLWKLRDTALARARSTKDPKDDGWHHNERVEAEHIVKALKDREVELQDAARRKKALGGGWGLLDRGRRFWAIHGARTNAHKTRPEHWPSAVPVGTLGARALHVAETMIGVMEHGGNNMGPVVSKIIRENGGTGPEPWCGDAVAYWYRHAGSKVVQRAWAAVSALGFLTGMKRVAHPRPGDIVCFSFSHTGVFVRWVDGNTIETIEGNTGASGAVSDSSTGGDGVYRKHRSTSLVSRYVRVTR